MSSKSTFVEACNQNDEEELIAQREFLNQITNLKTSILLEIGSGFGELALQLQPFAKKIYLSEINREKQLWLARYCLINKFENIEIILNKLQNYSKNLFVDLVYSFNTFSFLSNRQLSTILKTAYSLLKPGGYLVFGHLQSSIDNNLKNNSEEFKNSQNGINVNQKIKVSKIGRNKVQIRYRNVISQYDLRNQFNYKKIIYPRKVDSILNQKSVAKFSSAHVYKNVNFEEYSQEDSSYILVLQK